MAKERMILSREASHQIEADVQAIMANVIEAARSLPGARVSSYGGQYAGAGWTKTPRKIEVPDVYGAVDVNKGDYGVLSAYIEPDWHAVDRGSLAYTLAIFDGGASRKSKSEPYVRVAVRPASDVSRYVVDAYATALDRYPVLRANSRRRK